MVVSRKMMEISEMQGMAEGYGLQLSKKMREQLAEYAEILLEWNQKVNLTSITEPKEVEEKHFLDSLLLAKSLPEEGTLADVGSGAGFPGVVAKIYRPQMHVSLFEPTGKRVQFLQLLAQRLGLTMEIYKERAEEAARKQWRQGYDVVTARAVAVLPALCEYCLPLVRVGGQFIAMKGHAGEEVAAAENAMEKLGGKLAKVETFTLPSGALRSLIFVHKERETPKIYPRAGGVIKKRPL